MIERTKSTWSIQLDDLVFTQNPGTMYWYGEIKGFGKADIRGDVVEYSGANGGFIGEQLYSFRRIPLKLGVYQPDQQKLRKIINDMNAVLTINKYINCRVTTPDGRQYGFKAKLHSAPDVSTSFVDDVTCEVDLVCEDPYIYDYSEGVGNTFTLEKTKLGGWLVKQWQGMESTYKKGWLSERGQPDKVVTNSGTVTAYPTFTISGAVTRPSITHKDTGDTIALDITTAPGDTLYIDTNPKNPAVLLNGYGIEGALTSAQMFGLAPGDNRLEYKSDSSSDTATVTGHIRYAYEGIL